jgi:hypothetical protein
MPVNYNVTPFGGFQLGEGIDKVFRGLEGGQQKRAQKREAKRLEDLFTDEQSQKNMSTSMLQFLTGEKTAEEVTASRADWLVKQGKDPSDTLAFAKMSPEDQQRRAKGALLRLNPQAYQMLYPTQKPEESKILSSGQRLVGGTTGREIVGAVDKPITEHEAQKLEIEREKNDIRRLEQKERSLDRGLAKETNELKKLEIKQKITETKRLIDEKKQLASKKKEDLRTESGNALDRISGLLSNDSFAEAFDRFESAVPERLRSQSYIDNRAKVDQIAGLLEIAARDKVAGQGPISDSEGIALGRSATLLKDPLISKELAKEELIKALEIFKLADELYRKKTPAEKDSNIYDAELFKKYGIPE